jgi:hypothetical protein
MWSVQTRVIVVLLAAGALALPSRGGPGGGMSQGERSSDEALPADLRAELEAIDPLAVGWTTEAINSRCGRRLKELVAILREDPEVSPERLAGLVASEYEGGALRPDPLQEVFVDEAFRVRRGRDHEPSDRDSSDREPSDRQPSDRNVGEGPAELAAALTALIAPLWGADRGGDEPAVDPHFHFKFKIFGVEELEDRVFIDAYYAADGSGPDHLVEQSATWRIEWSPETESEPLRIRSIEVRDFEEVESRVPGRSLFSDCTGSVFAKDPTFVEQLLPGLDHWRARMATSLGLPLLGHSAGIAVGDVNGDELEDLFLCQPGGLPNRLYLNAGDGTVVPGPEPSDASILDFTRSALLVDWDDDGDRDLAAVVGAEIVFFSNDGTGRFRWEAILSTPGVTMLTAADYDQDGDLDLYATGYSVPGRRDAWPVPYHDAENGLPNVLVANLGDWKFADVTAEAGLDANNHRFSFSSAWEDYDNDGDPDLYVANDFGRNCLYRNDGGHFTDVAAEAGVEDLSAGMSAHWGDFDGDGWMDIFVSNMFSSAGNRVTYQRRFKPESEAGVRGHFQRHARGNTLFQSAGDGTFRDVSEEAGITMGRWAWGSIFADFNNDGREDLVVPNGFLTSTKPADL